jgi:hypothetical protein
MRQRIAAMRERVKRLLLFKVRERKLSDRTGGLDRPQAPA